MVDGALAEEIRELFSLKISLVKDGCIEDSSVRGVKLVISSCFLVSLSNLFCYLILMH